MIFTNNWPIVLAIPSPKDCNISILSPGVSVTKAKGLDTCGADVEIWQGSPAGVTMGTFQSQNYLG